MELVVLNDYAQMSRSAADMIAQSVNNIENCVLGLATGSTPLGLYSDLVEDYEQGKVSFADVTTFNLDEYVGLSGYNPQSYRYFMNENLFDKVDIDKASTHIPDGMATDFKAACADYERAIEEAGGIDVQLLGLGHNGHIGFNEPTDYFPKRTHEVELTKSTIDANSRLFDSIDKVPIKAITMGIGTIMAARHIVVVASGKDKAEIVKKVVEGKVTPEVPASILQFHPSCTFFVDEEAGSLCL